MTSSSLRLRFLATLAASGVVGGLATPACGGAVDGPGGSSTSSSGASGGTSSSSSSSSSSSGSSGTSGSTSSSSGSSSGASGTTPVAPTCQYGQPTQECFTHEQLESQWRSPGMAGGDPKPGEAPFLPNGCMAIENVHDGCCNAAVAGPSVEAGGKCCYTFCTGGCCGRPFVVDGETRVPEVIARAGWCAEPGPAADPALDPFVRARVAAAWSRDAAMEHASVAAFARFTLELLAHAAPADLLLAAQAATRDEIEHARACFAIASRYAGETLGPDALDARGADASRPLAEIVAAVVTEGCIGETLSALLAEARLARAEDAFVRATLARIAEEEARHAELAWRFVGWAIAEEDKVLARGATARPIRAAALAAFEALPPDAADATLAAVPSATLRKHGLLDPTTARAVVSRAMDEVIAPCARALDLAPARAA